jgi:DNA-binding CsgD family transcriptional regulator
MDHSQPTPTLALDSLHEAVERIRTLKDEVALKSHITSIVIACGLTNFVFAAMTRNDQERSHYRFLIGCRPRWCQIYNAKYFYLNDPFIEHALKSNDPVLGRQISAADLTQGQRQMMDMASKYGFATGLVVPAHGHDAERVGVLYLGSSEPANTGEPRAWKCRWIMKLVSNELLEWWMRRMKNEFIDKHLLSELDIQLLGHERQGLSSIEISTSTGQSKRNVDETFRKMIEKMGVSTRKEAAVSAYLNAAI